MNSTILASKILDLQKRLRQENQANRNDSFHQQPPNSHFAPSSRPGSGRRPNRLVEVGVTPTRTRKLDLPVANYVEPSSAEPSEVNSKIREIMELTGIICINGKRYPTDITELEHRGELGNGSCGHVVKMLHKPSDSVIAVKQMRRSSNMEENKRITMDLEVVLKSHDCDYIVKCLGCFITDSDVWICMELMATCFDKLLKRLGTSIPEDILGKVTVATVKALHYLKENHGVIHRDVKPSNILLDEKGNVKLCDFGISGRLVDSKAKTKNAGCAAYMAPERISPPDPCKPDYDIRADVWSLGITLVELATGSFPYVDCNSDFEVLTKVLYSDPPTLPEHSFSPEFRHFVDSCLAKNYEQRPKYKELLKHPFIVRYENKYVDVAAWFAHATASTRADSSNRAQKRCSSLFKGKQQQCSSDGTGRRTTFSGSSAVAAAGGFKCVPNCLTSKGGENNNNTNSVNNNNNADNGSNNKKQQPNHRSQTKSESEGFKGVWNSIMKSPLFSRKKKSSGGSSPQQEQLPQQQQQQQQGLRDRHQEVTNTSSYREGIASGNISPLMLHRFLHQQIHHINGFNKPHRSTSVSPTRGMWWDGERSPVEYDDLEARLAADLRLLRLNQPPPLRPAASRKTSASPEPPPRINKMVSPLLMRRIHYNNTIHNLHIPDHALFTQSSYIPLSRSTNCGGAAPDPPPRRRPYGESSSVPCSPVPCHRCNWQHSRMFNTTQ